MSQEEFQRKLAFVRRNSLMINDELMEAKKLSDLAEASLQSFTDLFKTLQVRTTSQRHWTLPKRRWKRAIGIVILRIGLAKTTTRLAEIAARQKFRTPQISSAPLSPRSARGPSGGLLEGQHLPSVSVHNGLKRPALESVSEKPAKHEEHKALPIVKKSQH
jgi:hypothetical protein